MPKRRAFFVFHQKPGAIEALQAFKQHAPRDVRQMLISAHVYIRRNRNSFRFYSRARRAGGV